MSSVISGVHGVLQIFAFTNYKGLESDRSRAESLASPDSSCNGADGSHLSLPISAAERPVYLAMVFTAMPSAFICRADWILS